MSDPSSMIRLARTELRRPRVPAGALALLIVTMLLAGCGGTRAQRGGSPRRGGSSRLQRDPHLARRRVLVGGYVLAPGRPIGWDPQSGRDRSCLHLGELPRGRVRQSRLFTNTTGLAGGSFSYTISAFASVAAARRTFDALHAQRVSQCLEPSIIDYMAPRVSNAGARLSSAAEVTVLPVSVPGHPDAFGYRVAMTAAPTGTGDTPFTIYADLLGFLHGRTLVELATYSSIELFPAVIERRLLRILARGLPPGGSN
jgi:hypothetical protein